MRFVLPHFRAAEFSARNKVLRAVLAFGIAASASSLLPPANAEQAQSFPDVFRQAERSSPRLMEAEAEVAAAEGRVKQASAWLNPVVGVELEDFAGSGPYRGTSQAQTTVSIGEPLELGGQRSARQAVGRAELTTAQARRTQIRADFGYDLAMAYADAEATQARVGLLTEDLDRAQEDLRSARALVGAGKEGELRAIQVEAAASAVEADLETARADAVAALALLSSLAGVADPYTGAGPSLVTGSVRPSAIPRPGKSSSAPAVATALAERNTAERRLTVEQKRAIPTPSLSIGARRFAGDDATAWVAGISIPLPLFDRNSGGIAAARADLGAAEARFNAARLDADAEWLAAAAQVNAAGSRSRASDRAEASANEAYRLARIGYDAGRTPLSEVLSSRRALTEAQLRVLDARLARLRAEASLARLAGRIPFIE